MIDRHFPSITFEFIDILQEANASVHGYKLGYIDTYQIARDIA